MAHSANRFLAGAALALVFCAGNASAQVYLPYVQNVPYVQYLPPPTLA